MTGATAGGAVPAGDTGFTLIEALVAMAILAVASAGLIRATQRHIDLIRGVETRMIAGWVADNRLAELSLPGAAALPPSVDMLGRNWRVAATSKPSEDPEIAAVEIIVSEPGMPGSLVTLRGFHDTQAPG